MDVTAAPEINQVVAALQKAAAATGSDFHYLLGTAMRESSLKPAAQSSTSSAGGLFQFIDQTWLGLVKNHGAKYGLGVLADAITQGKDGRYRAASDSDRSAILALKKDPQISALMAGEYAKSTQSAMQDALGRPVCGGELYAAHFLGADAACKLIKANQTDPAQNAARLFPEAASANHTLFFRPDGAPKSVGDVYHWAMQQPGGSVLAPQPPAAIAAPGPAAPAPLAQALGAHQADIQALMASVLNWQPGGFFGGSENAGLSSPLLLSHGLLDMLSSANEAPANDA
jgi:hypothetical protein